MTKYPNAYDDPDSLPTVSGCGGGGGGDVGPTGPAGPAGPTGPVGPPGPKGNPGIKGDTGATGLTGPAGTNGTNGTNGINGATGPIGPAGPKGDTGPQGGEVFIFKPGGVASNNTYTSWSLLMTARAAVNGLATIVLDDSITSPITLPTGIWNLTKNTIVQGYAGDVSSSTTLQLDQGVQLTNPYEFKNLKITGNANSTANIISTSPFTSIDITLYNTVIRTLNSATAPIILSPQGNITLDGYSRIENSSGFVPFQNNPNGNFNFYLNNNSIIQANTLNIVGVIVNVFINTSAAFFNTNQSSLTSVLNIYGANLIGNLSLVPDGYVLSKNGVGTSSWIPMVASTISTGTVNTAYVSDGYTNFFSKIVDGYIANNAAISYSKLANITTDSLLGRDTTGTGTLEVLSVSGGLEFTGSGGIRRSAISGDVTIAAGSTTSTVTDLTITGEQLGSLIYFNGTNWVQLPPGLDGYSLVTHNSSGAPTWELIGGGGGSPTGPAGGDLTGSYPNPTIGTNKVTFSKFQQITTDTLLGRDTTGTGNVEQLSVSGGLEFTGSGGIRRSAISGDVTIAAGSTTSTVTDLTITGETQGSVLYFNGTSWVRLPPSTDGYVLTTHSTGQNPTWSLGGAPSGAAGGDLTGTYPNPTIDVNKVTVAKIQQITTDSLLGRDTAGTGNVEVITLNPTLEMTGAQVLQRAALTGDVIASAGSNVTDIAPGVIVNADVNASAGIAITKLANITTDRLLGRDTPATGAIEELTVSGGLEFTGSTGIQRSALTGDVTASAGSNVTAIAAGVIVDADVNASAGIAVSKLASQSALSVLGNPTNAGAVPSAIIAGTDGYVLARNGTTLAFVPVGTTNITNNSVTVAKIQPITTDSLLGRDTAGTGNVEVITLNSTLEMTGSQVLQRAAISGDITIAAGSNTSDITAGVIIDADVNASAGIAFSKLATIATDKILGRDSVGTGALEALSVSGGLEFTGTTGIQRSAISGDVTIAAGSTTSIVTDLTITGEQQGSVLYFNGTNWVQLAPSTDGYVLTTHSTAANPTWSVSSGGPPNGAAGGDLTGTYPNPQIATGAIINTDINASAGINYSKLETVAALSILGNGTNATAVTTPLTAGTDGNIIRRSGTAVGFGSIDLSSAGAVGSSLLPFANIASLTGLSILGRSANTTGVMAAITGVDGQALRVSGTTLGFGTLATAAYTDNSVTLAKLATQSALSVLANGTVSTAVPTAIAAAADGQVFLRAGSTLAFGTISSAGITDGNVTMAKLADLAGLSVIGRSGNTTGVPAAITASITGQVLIYNGTSVSFGSPNFGTLDVTTTGVLSVGSTPASAGQIRIPNNTAIESRNAANSADIILARTNTSNDIYLADSTGTVNIAGTKITVATNIDLSTPGLRFGTAVTAPNIIQLDNATNSATAQPLLIQAQNATGTSATGGILDLRSGTGTNADGNVTIRRGSTTQTVWSNSGVNFATNNLTTTGALNIGANCALAGLIRLSNATNIRFRNAANTADVDALAVDSSNNVILGNSSDTSILLNDSTDLITLNTANVTRLTISSSVIESSLTTIRFATTVVNPVIQQNDDSTNSITGDSLTINAQNATGTTATGGSLLLKSGTGTTANGVIRLYNGSTNILSGFSTSIDVAVPDLRFVSTVTTPSFGQNDTAVNSATGQSLLIKAQGATGTTSTGGILDLRSGTGTTIAGAVTVRTGSTVQTTWNGSTVDFVANNLISTGTLSLGSTPATSGQVKLPNNVGINFRNAANTANMNLISSDGYNNTIVGDGYIMFEATQLSTGARITALNRLSAITTTQMPSGTGDGVTYIASSSSTPLVNPTSGYILYAVGGVGLYIRGPSGTVTLLALP